MPAERAFDAASHTYTVGGVAVPSVTQALSVLREFEGLPFDLMERARLFGRHVHMAVDLFNRGELDEAQLDPALAPYLAGWKSFLHESGATVVHSERQVWHGKLRYAGTLDATVKMRAKFALLDVKSGACPRSVGAQTAAYAAALEFDGIHTDARYCVTLRPNCYKLISLTDRADFPLFQSCLNVWRFRNGEL